ncbi:polyadenylation and cleavage factor homolog 4 isoform X2 [Coffea eugenioides]|uniref:polyadenylation and cleavage factor homolog 4 isoform X2 n=1 Tax=Coffea eugenioides TaxID=49369 RepID=UPI000F60D451|nr:polyadenylation and cleavage factor homolog 4 isoform X2 [Coffea eugenioides]
MNISTANGGGGGGGGGGAGGGSFGNSNRTMANDVVSKPVATSILDRFRDMLKEREDELRVSEGGDVVLLSSDDVVRLYEVVLSDLVFNSKPVITDLTIIAGEQRRHGQGIADAICARIIEAPVEQKLPFLYLLDSIVKNIGRDYVRYFSARLPEVFCEAYNQVHPNMYPSMRHLFKTWSSVFHSSVLRKIEALLEFSPPMNDQPSSLTSGRASESPRPTHGIHVNPKYLEARRQLGHATADAAVTERLSLRDHTDNTASGLGAVKMIRPSAARLAGSSSPYGVKHGRSLSPSLDNIAVDGSPRRAAEKASPSQSGFEYGFARTSGRHEEASDWQRNTLTNGTSVKFETPAYRYNNGIDLDRPRALIDAYGIDEREKPPSHKHLKVDHSIVNGINKSASLKTWQNTEEEEFNWEDMSPTLGDSSRNNDLFSSSIPPSANFRTRPGFRTHPDPHLATSDFRNNFSKQAQLPIFSDSSPSENVSAVSSVRGVIKKVAGFRDENKHVSSSHFPKDGFSMPQSHVRSSQQHLSIKGSGRNHQMSFSGMGIAPSSEYKPPSVSNFPNADPRIRGPSAVVSRIGSSGFASLTPEMQSIATPASMGVPPSVNIRASYHQALLASPPMHEQIGYQPDAVGHQGMTMPNFPGQQLGSVENNPVSMPQPSSQPRGLIPPNLQVGPHVNLSYSQPQPLPSQEARQNMVPPVPYLPPSNLVRPPLDYGYVPQAHGVHAIMGAGLQNVIPNVQSSMPVPSIVNASLSLPGVSMPPLQGSRPVSSTMIHITQNPGPVGPNPPAGGPLSGLFNTLMAQGLISLTKEAPMQDSMVLDFNQDTLRVRHESAIKALYADLPRQCTACGVRFKCQEAHSSHMDWHVKRNRKSKNKQKPSRNWFVRVDMWLRNAEALGTDAVPSFLPIEDAVEKNDDEELAVPADDDQKFCALCGEPFDDFYSDETEEWMYRGAVYMNAPTGSTAGMNRSQLGPIIHSKCRSETSGASAEVLSKDRGGYTEEGSEKK